MKYRLLCFYLVSLVTIGLLNAQPIVTEDPYMKFDRLTKKSGLSSNYILDILQDKTGYIWIATADGLNKYDGFNFTHYKNLQNDSTSLKGNLISCLEEDEDGTLWIGTQNGISKYNRNSDSFQDILLQNEELTNEWNNDHIRAILADSNHILWIETTRGDLIKYNSLQHNSTTYNHQAPTMVNTYFYHTIYKDNDGLIWIGGRFMGIISFDPDKEKFRFYRENPNHPEKKRENDVSLYFQDSNDRFWIAGIDGLYTMNPSTEIFEKQLAISTFSIVEDENTDLWIGTGSGLYKYKSEVNTFTSMNRDENNPQSLIHDHINKVYLDNNQNLWIGTTNGLSIFRPSKNKFKHIYHITGDDRTPNSSNISSLLQLESGEIWIGTDNAGIDCLNENYLKISSYHGPNKWNGVLNSNRISVLKQDSDGDIWVGQWSGRGFNIIDPTNRNIQSYSFLPNSLKADWYHDFYEDSKGNHWVGLWGAMGLYQFDKEKGYFKDITFQLRNNPIGAIKNLTYDGKQIWLGLKNQTFFISINPETQKVNTYLKDMYNSYDFNHIEDIIQDHQNQTWFLTNNGNYLKSSNPRATFKKVLSFPAQSLSKKNPALNNLTDEVNIDTLTCLYSDENGVTWLGTLEGLFKIELNKTVQQFTLKSNPGLGSDSIWSMVFIPPDQLWLGTEKGLSKMNISEEVFEFIDFNPEDYLSSHLIKCINEDKDGKIWVGTTNRGLNRLNPNSEKMKQFNSNLEDEKSFWGETVNCIYVDKEGTVWIGGHGLNKFISATESFLHYTVKDGLCDNSVMSIQEDEFGELWIATLNGLSVFNPQDESFQNYFEKDGLQDNEFSNASCRLRSGEIIFGGKNGVNVCKPATIYSNKKPPPIVLTSFSIFDQELDIKGKTEIELDYDENYFSFEYAALDFSNPEYVQYAYMLQNADKDWIYTNANSRVAKYTNIDPGNYRFMVKANNGDGLWNEKGIFINIYIKPPFWKTIWFIILEILAVGLIIFFYIKYRERKIIEQNQFQLLEQKLLRSQMNPHFIFNSLSSIQSFIFENNPLEAGSYLSRFAELIRSILYNSREEFITLEKEVKTLQNYLDLQQLRYDHKFDYTLDIDPLIQADLIQIPPMLAQPFIENAIEHGIKHLNGRGFISVSFTLMPEKGSILLLVEDNGIGIKASKKLKKDKPKNHTSLATIIANERIDVFNKGQKKKQFFMEIGEITDYDGQIQGTKVKFIIPYRKL
jgi:ligand-binding sensor domain-containing protein